jgi:hypothetical protein
MADNRQQLLGKWIVKVKGWVWEYEFFPDGKVTWRDTQSRESGWGRWSMSATLVNMSWSDSQTKESWQLPLPSDGEPTKRTWYASSYYTGPYAIEKQALQHVFPKTVTAEDIEVDVFDVDDPQDHPNYIDKMCTHVAYGIYNGGFWVYLPPGITPYPIEIPEKQLWFLPTGEKVNGTIHGTQDAAVRAAGGVNPNRIAYHKGVGEHVVCPTAFTYKTAPTIVNTASIVVDKLIEEVTDELMGILVMLVVRVAVSTGGSIVNRAVEVRQLKTRDARAKAALERARARRNAVPTVPTIRPKATSSQLREMLRNPNDWFVWATHEPGIVQNQRIIFKGSTNTYANQQVHLLRGTEGIKGTKYGPNKVAIKAGSRPIRPFTGNEFMVDEIPAGEGLHFHQSDLNGL